VKYTLEPNASDEQIGQAQEILATELAEVLALMLRARLEQASRQNEIVTVPSRPNDPSVWFPEEQPITFRSWRMGAHTRALPVFEGTRAYMRLAPAGWLSGQPDRDAVENSPIDFRLWPLGRVSELDGGMNKEGVVRVAPAGGADPVYTATQWFSSNGELWSFDANVVFHPREVALLAGDYLVERRAEFLSKSVQFLEHFGASSTIRVEAGISRLEGVRWADQFPSGQVDALEPQVVYTRTSREWNEERQQTFVTAFYNRVRSAFGLRHVSREQLFPDRKTGTL
jgi:hypothetical protein